MILLLGLATSAPAARPDWVTHRPRQEAYFIGIGVATRGADLSESRDRATQNALNDIATQIQVNISSNIELEDAEDAADVHQSYLSEIKAIVESTELAGVEIVDTYEGADEVWVYAHLSKQKFAQLRQEKIDKARRRAFSLFEQAEEKYPRAVTEALSLYLQALQPLAAALGDPLTVSYQESRINLDTTIPSRIRNILSSIALEASPVPSGIKRGTDIDVPLKVRGVFKTERGTVRPLPDLPLEFAFTQGSGRLINRVRTASSGLAVSRLTRIEDAGRAQVIRAGVDLASLIPLSAEGISLSIFAVPTVDIDLAVSKQKVFIHSSEINLGEKLQVLLVEPLVKKALSARGVEFADDPAQADVVVEIEAQTRQGNRAQNIHFSFLDLTLSLKRRADGVEIFKTALDNVKGAGPNFKQAGIKAFRKAGKELEKKALPEILEQL